jgi:hypothetical protein
MQAEQAQWLARLVGRFRIGGRVERGILHGDVSGVADCAAVGAGAGVQCFINAAWNTIEPIAPLSALQRMMMPPPASEQVMILRPAVVVLGLNPDTAEIRALMVTDDSVAHTWAGRLDGDTLTARRTTTCFVSQTRGIFGASSPPCFRPLEISAEPDSDVVTMVHRAAGVTIRLSLYRDLAASADKPMKSKRVK